MKLLYTLRYLLRQKENSLIKIISLTLGLVVGLVLFSQIAFEMSYDNFFPDKENLYRLYLKGVINDEPAYDQAAINLPFPSTMYDEMDEVVSATAISAWIDEYKYIKDDKSFKELTVVGDSLFFQTLGFTIISGNPEDMNKPFTLFLSSETAKKIFGDQNPVGQYLIHDEKPYQISGVFEDVPKNSHLKFDVVFSLITWTQNRTPSWRGQDGYGGYIKLAPGIDPSVVEAKIPDMMRRHYDVEAEIAAGTVRSLYLKPVTEMHTGQPEVKRACMILSILAFSLLLAAAMNYILISLASLTKRAKTLGIHKCSGASDGNIFSLFLYETTVLIGISSLLSILLIASFRSSIETLLKTDLSIIFNTHNLWVSLVIITALFLVTGLIPARIFSSIPVNHIFQTYTKDKKIWKRGLLFAQFSGIAFIMTLLAIIVSQYHLVLHKDMGYTTENIIYTEFPDISIEERERIKAEFERLSEVASATLTTHVPFDWLMGNTLVDPESQQNLFTGRIMTADADYLNTFEMELVSGRNFAERSKDLKEVLVNETFASMLHMDDPVGYKFLSWGGEFTIAGVVKDFQNQSFFEEIPAIYIMAAYSHEYYHPNKLAIRLNTQLTPEFMNKSNQLLTTLLPNTEIEMISYEDRFEWSYRDTRLFRNSVITAAFIMLAITLIGLFGFVQDEVFRRQKEIAIRKVNGAEVLQILLLLSKEIAFVALPAIIIGLLFSYQVGLEWLQQFVVKIPLGLTLFSLSSISVFTIIILCVLWRCWGVANENPVHSLKTE